MKANVAKGHGHEPYPVLFDRKTPWEKKESLLKFTKGRGDEEGEGAGANGKTKATVDDGSKPEKRKNNKRTQNGRTER